MTTQTVSRGSGNFVIPVREFSSVEELRAHQAAIHRKFFPRPRMPVVQIARPEPKPAPKIETKPKVSDFHVDQLLALYHEVRVKEAQTVVSVIAKMTPAKVREIQTEVARDYGVTLDEIISNRRVQPATRARQFAMWRVKNETTLSLPQIGRLFGGRDHTTVLHAIRQVTARLEKEAMEQAA